MKDKKFNSVVNIGCLFILGILFFSIIYINFSGNPTFYYSDMYSDMKYAAEVWAHKSIFPEGWVFGNQLYVVATPVVASLFYGITHNLCTAMALASTFMAIIIVLSFNWMLKPIFKDITPRLVGIVSFMILTLFSGNPVHALNGWQLLFTMCSYYACYAITAFLSFGCYLRSNYILKSPSVIILVLSCLLSFGTGMQSLRQTAIMTCPLIAVELTRILYRKINKQKISTKSLLVSAFLIASNILGVICSKIIYVEQVTIFGETSINSLSNIFVSFFESVVHIVTLISQRHLFTAIGIVIIVLISVLACKKLPFQSKPEVKVCSLLFTFSILCVFAIDTFTQINVRSIYYFMLFPLLAFFTACIYSLYSKRIKSIVLIFISLFFLFSIAVRLYPVMSPPSKDSQYTEISDYLTDNDITTVYSYWNVGEKIAIASEDKIQAGFLLNAFEATDYLCNPEVFNADPNHCAYIFSDKDSADEAVRIAHQNNLDFTLMKHFEESDIYIYVSKDPIMQSDVSTTTETPSRYS